MANVDGFAPYTFVNPVDPQASAVCDAKFGPDMVVWLNKLGSAVPALEKAAADAAAKPKDEAATLELVRADNKAAVAVLGAVAARIKLDTCAEVIEALAKGGVKVRK